MRKGSAVLLAILAAIGAYALASWVIGGVTQRQWVRGEQRLLQVYPNLTVISREYHRGIFDSTEDVTYGIAGNAQRLSFGISFGSLRLTLHSTIHHGPFPQLRALGLASVDSQLQLPEAVTRSLDPVLHGQPLLQLHTAVGFTGDSVVQPRSPAFQYRAPGGSTITWGGVTGSTRVVRALSAYTGTLSAPELIIDSPQGHLTLQGLQFSVDMQRALDAFYVGRSAVRLATLTYRPGSGSTLSLKGLSLASNATIHSGFIDQHISIGAEQFDSAQFSFQRVGYDMSFEHLDGASLAALISAMRAAQRLGSTPEAARANLAIVARYGVEMALHEPVIHIERIGFLMPEGQLQLSAKVAIPGLTRDELQGPAAMAALLQHLDASADLRIDAAVLDKLVSASGRSEQLGPQLQQLEKQGYLRQDGSAFTASLTFRSGKLLINGQPYPPAVPLTTP
jgi:uncharacterized protein YdgA (DUF945 family)